MTPPCSPDLSRSHREKKKWPKDDVSSQLRQQKNGTIHRHILCCGTMMERQIVMGLHGPWCYSSKNESSIWPSLFENQSSVRCTIVSGIEFKCKGLQRFSGIFTTYIFILLVNYHWKAWRRRISLMPWPALLISIGSTSTSEPLLSWQSKQHNCIMATIPIHYFANHTERVQVYVKPNYSLLCGAEYVKRNKKER